MKKTFKVFVTTNYFDSVIHITITDLPATEKALTDISRIVESYVNEEIGLYLKLCGMGVIK